MSLPSALRIKALSRSAAVILPLLGLLCSVPGAVAQPFATATLPSGIASDPDGNVYIVSLEGAGSPQAPAVPLITKFDPAGKRVFQMPLGAGGSGGAILPASPSARAGRLVYDDVLGTLWYLSPAGLLFHVNPDDGAAGAFADMRQEQFETANAIEVGSGAARPFTGKISVPQSTWGDIALMWLRTDQPDVAELDFFMSAVTEGVPVIARLRIAVSGGDGSKLDFTLVAADVVVASLATGPSPVPTGIAVAPQQETVLTTLPVMSASGAIVERLVFFPVSLDPQQGGSVTVANAVISSRGMSSDENGAIFIATGPEGAAGCGDSNGAGIVGGALVVLWPDGGGKCYSTPEAVDSQDTAIVSATSSAYMTLGRENAVLRVAVTPQQGAQTQSTDAGSGMRSMDYRGRVLRGKDSTLKGRLRPLR